jgi:hypothetical protein
MPFGQSNTEGNIPEWLRPYIMGGTAKDAQGNTIYEVDPQTGEVIKDASGQPIPKTFTGILPQVTALGTSPLAPYDATMEEAIKNTTNRVARFDPLQEYAYNATAAMTPSNYIQQGGNLMNTAANRTYDVNTARQYSSPYMQMVVDQQKKAAMQDYKRQLPQLGASAFQAGAGRGTRSNLARAEANRNLQNNLQNIQAQGLQNAWEQGQNQFNTEANRQYQIGTGLGQLGQTQYEQMMGINAAQQAAGGAKQTQLQNILNTNYEDYLANQRRPYQQLGFMLDAYQGVPVGSYSQTMFTPSARPDVAGQTAGAITSGIGSIIKR